MDWRDVPPLGSLHSITETSPYAYASGDTAYYSNVGSGSFSVRVAAEDTGSGLDRAEYPETVSAGGVYTVALSGDYQYEHVYEFEGAEGIYTVTLQDGIGRQSSVGFTVIRDATPPTLTLEATVQGTDVHVTWNVGDSGSGVDASTCLLEVREDEGAWQTFSTECGGDDTHDGQPGHTYTFRLTASDNVSNADSLEVQAVVPYVTKYYYANGQQAGDRIAYLPYGGVRLGDASTLPTDYGFTGQRLEAGLGLMHYGARFYSPRLGRFISADSIVPEPGEPQALNRYSYVYNNPLRFVDPTGFFTEEELINWGVYTAEELKGLAENQAEWYGILMQAELGDFIYFGDSDMLDSHSPMGSGQFTLYNEKLILAGRLTVWNAQSESYNLLWDEHSVRAWEGYFAQAAAATGSFGTYRPDTPVEDYKDVGACAGAVVGVCAGRVTLDTGERYHYSTVIGVYTPQAGGAALRGIAINADDFAGMSLQVSVSVNIPLTRVGSVGVGFFGWPGGAWGMEIGGGGGIGGVPIGPVSVSASVQLLESTRLPQ